MNFTCLHDKSDHGNKSFIIGIAGGSASGKSTIADSIVGKTSVVVAMDRYYINDAARKNWDTPDAIDVDLLACHIKMLARGDRVLAPTRDYVNYCRGEPAWIEPATVIIIEGIFALAIECIRDMCDMKIYIDCPADLMLSRRIIRDVGQRGCTLENILNQYNQYIKPAFDDTVEPSKKYANIIIPPDRPTDVAVQLIRDYVVRHTRR